MRSFPIVASLVSALIVSCAGYRLGPTNGEVAGGRSIQINPFLNKAIEARLGEAVTSALRKRLQQDGTYRLATQGDGDIVVTGVITRFERGELSFQPSDVLTVRDYSLALIAQITAVERSTGRTNINRPVFGRTTIRVGADLTSAERQAIPLLAADLAKNAASLLVDGAW